MSGLEAAAVVGVAIWLSVLTVAILLLVRQLGLLTAWTERYARAGNDGIDVGVEIPAPAMELLPELESRFGYVVFLAGDCQPCREFALEASRSDELVKLRETLHITAAVSGAGIQAEEVAKMLPSWISVARNDDAELLTKTFEVETTPAVYEVDRGTVTGRAVAGYGLINFLNLVEARATSDAAEIADRRVEDFGVEVQQVNSATTGG